MLSRRDLLRAGVGAGSALAFGPAFWRSALAAEPATPGPGPYGEPGAFDANGIAVPRGFTTRKIAQGGQEVAGYTWHLDTDGQGCFPMPDGGWVLTANSEVDITEGGGASMVRFAPDGAIVEARRILADTDNNCAGGATPWGTWLSCEEEFYGQVWECDPTGSRPAVARPAMGIFTHEAVCVDPREERLYLTEDQGDGCLYRFTPDAYPDLSSGTLEALVADAAGAVSWVVVPPAPPTRYVAQAQGAKAFNGGEGIWYDSGIVYFTTKGDVRVWAYDVARQHLEVLYDKALAGDGSPLKSVDNLCVSRAGDIYVCEDGDTFEICLISPERRVQTFVRLSPEVHGQPGTNETTGVVFDPSGRRMYFGVQRSFGTGAVYEVRGPFRGPGDVPDRVPPGGRIAVARAARQATVAQRGLRLRLRLSEPAQVRASLYSEGGRLVARHESTVALHDGVVLRLRPADRVPTRGRARLVVRLVDASGNRRVLRRSVEIR